MLNIFQEQNIMINAKYITKNKNNKSLVILLVGAVNYFNRFDPLNCF